MINKIIHKYREILSDLDFTIFCYKDNDISKKEFLKDLDEIFSELKLIEPEITELIENSNYEKKNN